MIDSETTLDRRYPVWVYSFLPLRLPKYLFVLKCVCDTLLHGKLPWCGHLEFRRTSVTYGGDVD